MSDNTREADSIKVVEVVDAEIDGDATTARRVEIVVEEIDIDGDGHADLVAVAIDIDGDGQAEVLEVAETVSITVTRATIVDGDGDGILDAVEVEDSDVSEIPKPGSA
jgi:hypothetical protein